MERGEGKTIIFPKDEKVRVDVYLKEKLKIPRSRVQNWIKEGRVRVEGKKISPHYLLKKGQKIEFFPPPASDEIKPENIPLKILYEDEYLAVIDKPAGMLTHPAGRRKSGTLINALLYYLGENLSTRGGPSRPGIVHRLDKDTSGILLIAKNNFVHEELAQQFKERKIQKTYLALVWGRFKDKEGEISAPVGRSPTHRKKMSIFSPTGKEALTRYKVLKEFSDLTFLKIMPLTGRTHQIRVHLSFLGHPIVGDQLYGGKKFTGSSLQLFRKKIQRTMLHAHSLKFLHPVYNHQIEVASPLPEDFYTLLSWLDKHGK